MGTIVAIIEAIPIIVPIIKDLIGLFVEAKRKGWIEDGKNIRSKIQLAESESERIALARSLFEHRPR